MRQSGDPGFPTHPGGAAVKWDRDQLAEIIDNDDLHVAPLRDDGATFGTPTWIWCVEVQGDLYVRAYHGTESSWYRAACRQRAGRIEVAGRTFEVNFDAADPKLSVAIDQAYRQKYIGSPYLASMTSASARAATIRITLRKP